MSRPEHRLDELAPWDETDVRPGVWQRIKRANARLEDSLLGDLIGVVCLFAIGWLGLVMIGVLQ
jgi:hypothetical protein